MVPNNDEFDEEFDTFEEVIEETPVKTSKKSLAEKVEEVLETESAEETPAESAEKKPRAKKAKKTEEVVIEPESAIAAELHTWDLPKTLFQQIKVWLEGKSEEELEAIDLVRLKSRVRRLVDENMPVSTTTELTKILTSKHDAGKEVTEDNFENIVTRINSEYERTRVQPCEAVGINAAHSIGEPGTQMTMHLPLRRCG